MTRDKRSFDPVSLGIMWDRLISITDECVSALVRTSFSAIVRESYDLSVVLFAPNGNSLAQGTFSMPSFTGTAPTTIRHMLKRFPPHTLQPGDVIITNDPWLGTGHLFDVNVMRPVFRGSKLVAYTLSITHLPDIGGRGFSATASQFFEEGLRIPICKLVRAGRLNEDLIELIEQNVRVSGQVIGDLKANITCNEVGGRLLLQFMDEYGIDDLAPLSEAIIGQTERAMRERIARIPQGVYRNEMPYEGPDGALRLCCAVTVKGDSVHFDFAGTDPAVDLAINVPFCYTHAFAAYSLKCVTIPTIPNNEGCIRPITVVAPEGCILNALPPRATGARHVTGHFVNPLVFGALADAVPDGIQADCGSHDILSFQGRDRSGRDMANMYFSASGFGALRGKDGESATPAPANITGTPSEVWENLTGMTVISRRLFPNSGGAGEFRGGLGQEVVLRNDTGYPMTASFFAQWTEFPTRGKHGGGDGNVRRYWINGERVNPRGRFVLKPGDTVRFVSPGGGGFGDPRARHLDKVARDVANGFVTIDGALRDYGVSIGSDGRPVRRVPTAVTG
jgi:N-methylhydantoinase B